MDEKPYKRRLTPDRWRPTVSSIIKASLPEGARATHTQLGKEAEARVAQLLGRIYGERRVVTGTRLSSGGSGRPDVLVMTDPPVLVEVKTCQFVHKRRLFGVAKTFTHSWGRLTRYAHSRRMGRVMVIEYRHKDGAVYFWIKGEVIDRMVEEKIKERGEGIEVFHIEFRDALKLGNILTEKGFELEYPDSSQKKMDEF